MHLVVFLYSWHRSWLEGEQLNRVAWTQALGPGCLRFKTCLHFPLCIWLGTMILHVQNLSLMQIQPFSSMWWHRTPGCIYPMSPATLWLQGLPDNIQPADGVWKMELRNKKVYTWGTHKREMWGLIALNLPCVAQENRLITVLLPCTRRGSFCKLSAKQLIKT